MYYLGKNFLEPKIYMANYVFQIYGSCKFEHNTSYTKIHVIVYFIYFNMVCTILFFFIFYIHAILI